MNLSQPTLTVIAGPNGTGKSTFTRATQEALRVPIIDPDNEARQLHPNNPEAAAIAGGKQAIKRARAYLDNSQSFAVETTLSGNTYLRMMVEAKSRGWQINLIYVGVDKVQISIERVAQRVAAGGHNVLQEDIRRRYTRSLTNLKIAIQQADYTSIFDNSARAGYRKILTIAGGRITERSRKLPEWIIAALPQELIEPNENQSTELD
jgi:predicted ABC-type ATPase